MIPSTSANANFRKNMFEVMCATVQDFLDGGIIDTYFSHSRKLEDLSNLPANIDYYGFVMDGLVVSTDDDSNSAKSKRSSTLFRLIQSGILVPEREGKGYKEHFARAVCQSIFDALAFVAPVSKVGRKLPAFSGTLVKFTTQHTKDMLVHRLISAISNPAESCSLKADKTDMNNFHQNMSKLSAFMKASLGWMTNDYPVFIAGSSGRYGSSNSKPEDLEEFKTTAGMYPAGIYKGLVSCMVNRLGSIAISVAQLLPNEGYRYDKPSYSLLHRGVVDYRIPALVFLLAPGLVIDIITIIGECVAKMRGTGIENCSPEEWWSKYYVISRTCEIAANPVNMTKSAITSPSRYSVVCGETVSSTPIFDIAPFIDNFGPGYYRFMSDPAVREVVNRISNSKLSHSLFIEAWSELQKTANNKLDLDYKKPREKHDKEESEVNA